jgi:curved DNA-binding protein CbpA
MNIFPLQFTTMKRAYDILSDPQKREVYDQYEAFHIESSINNIFLCLERVKMVSNLWKTLETWVRRYDSRMILW